MTNHVDDHPLAELFPLMTDAEINEMAEDIKANGQKSKIVLFDGKILDGRNRYRACLLASVEPQFTTYAGKNEVAFVVSLNLHRRHLTTSQRAVVAAKISEASRNSDHPISQENASKMMKVSKDAVIQAKKVIAASPEKTKEIEAGKKTVHKAQKEIESAKPKDKPFDKLPKDERGVTLPADKVDLWNRRDEIGNLAKMVSVARVAIEKAQDKGDILFRSINCSSAISHLNQAYADLSGAKPYCVCPMCQGKGCRACKDTGLLGRFAFKQIVPREFKREDER